MSKSLRTRLTFIFIGLAVGPVLLVSVILSQRSFTVEQEQAIDFQRQVVQRVSAEANAFLGDLENNLYLLGGELRSLAQPDRAQQLSLLLGSLNSGVYRDVYEELSLLDAQGREQVRVSRREVATTDELNDLSRADEFEQPKATRETYFSAIWFDATTGEPFITIAIPLSELRSVEVNAVLVADLRFGAVQNLIASLQIGGSQTIYVVNSEGRVVGYDDPSVVVRGKTVLLPTVAGRVQGLFGTDVLFATDDVQFGNLEFAVVAERPVSEALELAQNGLYISTVVTALALLAAVGLVTLTVRQVVGPIEKLSAVAHSIEEGDLSSRSEIKSGDEIGMLARSFNAMTSRLQEMIQSLEDRVKERVRDLTLAADVSREVARELDSTRLLSNVVESTATVFKLYHVSIFIYSESDQRLYLQQGTGEIGQRMVTAGKQFRLNDQGLVPQAAQNRQAVLSNDVIENADHVRNPLLPNTRSELAIPMSFRDRLIGVLDLQSEQVDRFKDEDVNIMKTLAEQIATAVRNAQLFEEVQQALEEAKRANSVKSAFLASMSHELRTPLNAVINYTRFVANGTIGPVNDEQREMLLDVMDSGRHLLNLINDVLDMSKIEAGALKLFVEDDVNVNVILDKAVASARSLMGEKAIEIQLAIDSNLPTIRGDRQRILQILLNIISNAIKYTEEGYIRIEATAITDEIVISVQDTGPGISPEDQPAVFTPFKQTETGLRQGGGTGLGLPISKNLTDAHNGRIWVESELGKGSTFHVALPFKSENLKPTFTGEQAK